MNMKKSWLLILCLVLVAGVALVGCAPEEGVTPPPPPPPEKEPFKVGLTAAITGYGAVTYLPVAEGVRIYFEKINDEGGINGHKVELYVEDDRAEPARAVSNVKKFLGLGINLLVIDSATATYSGIFAECEKANIPIIIAMSGTAKELPPEPHPLIFGAFYNVMYDTNILLARTLKDYEAGAIKMGLLGINIPGAKFATETLNKYLLDAGMETTMDFVPAGATDVSPIASKIKAAGCNYAYFYGPGGYSILLWRSLDKIGWDGTMLVLPSDPCELTLAEFKGRGERAVFFALDAPLFFDYPIHKEIIATAEKYKATEINTSLCHGWISAKMVEEIFKKVSFPVSTEELLKVMNNLTVDHRPLYGVKTYTESDHVGSWTYLRLYKWDDEKETTVWVSDWYRADPLAKKCEVVGPEL